MEKEYTMSIEFTPQNKSWVVKKVEDLLEVSSANDSMFSIGKDRMDIFGLTHKEESFLFSELEKSDKIKNIQSQEMMGKGGKAGSGKKKYYAVWDGSDYLSSGLNETSKEEVRDAIIMLREDDMSAGDKKLMKKMTPDTLAGNLGYEIHEQDEPFAEQSEGDGDGDYGKGGKAIEEDFDSDDYDDDDDDDDDEYIGTPVYKGAFIFDDKGQDGRFTVVFKNSGEVYSASYPSGVNKNLSNVTDRMYITFGSGWRKGRDKESLDKILQSELATYLSQARGDSSWIGKEIKNEKDIPDKVKKYIDEISKKENQAMEKGGAVHSAWSNFWSSFCDDGALITGGCYINDGSSMGKGGKVSKDGDRHAYYVKAWKEGSMGYQKAKPAYENKKSMNYDEAQALQEKLDGEGKYGAVGIFAKKDNREISISLSKLEKGGRAGRKEPSGIKYETAYTKINGSYSGKDDFKQEDIFVGITKDGSIFYVDAQNKSRDRGDFSMSGSTDIAETREYAKELSRQSIESFVEDEGLTEFSERTGEDFSNVEEAVDYVIKTDGELSAFDNSTLTDEISVEGEEYLFGAQGGGQNDHEFNDLEVSFLDEKTLKKLKTLWKKYHLKELPATESFPKIEQDRNMILEYYIRHKFEIELEKGGKVYSQKRVKTTKRGKGIDKKIKAMKAGWRISKETGKPYFECRSDRSDKKPSQKI